MLLFLLVLSACASSFLDGAFGLMQGYHIDDETCSGLVNDNVTQQLVKCRTYLTSLANATVELHVLDEQLNRTARAGNTLKLAVDAGTGWVCPQPKPCTPPYCGCINITFNGATKSVASHVVDLADEVVLMDYTTSAASVYAHAAPYLDYADRQAAAAAAAAPLHSNIRAGHYSTPGSIRVGVAIHNPSQANQSYEVHTETELAALLASAATLLKPHSSFAGFAVFAEWWYAASKADPAPPGTAWPAGTGVWYSNHSMILDPDTAARDHFLAWAASRGIGEMYIAPHAMPPLVEGASGGSPATNVKFCDFMTVAGATYGIQVQFFSGSYSSDARFMSDCKGSIY